LFGAIEHRVVLGLGGDGHVQRQPRSPTSVKAPQRVAQPRGTLDAGRDCGARAPK
jgi:hypothetical protein